MPNASVRRRLLSSGAQSSTYPLPIGIGIVVSARLDRFSSPGSQSFFVQKGSGGREPVYTRADKSRYKAGHSVKGTHREVFETGTSLEFPLRAYRASLRWFSFHEPLKQCVEFILISLQAVLFYGR